MSKAPDIDPPPLHLPQTQVQSHPQAQTPAEAFGVTVRPAGWRFAIEPGQTVLAAAQAGGVVLPSSCRNGTCRSCICQLVGGQILHTIQWPGLSAEEKAQGYFLPCIALAHSDLTIEAPRAWLKD